MRPIFLLLTLLSLASVEGLHPVILVPGDGGAQLEAKLDKPVVVHYLCSKKTEDFFNIWLNRELLVPLIIDCWVDNVRLVYNFTTRTTENSPGVEIKVPGFGDTYSVEYLDPSKASAGVYFINIVEQSLLPLGYERNTTIRGAPFDFRKAPNELGVFIHDLQLLIEDTYQKQGNKSVILLSHSMGGPIAVYLLNKMSQGWKDQHIKALITLGAPWGGSVKAWKVFASGDNLGVVVLPAHTMREFQKTSPSTAYLLPSKHFWGKDEVVVSCPGKGNYTVNEFEKFFTDINYPEGYAMYEDTNHMLWNPDVAPGVEVHCLHGQGVSTVESFFYKDEKYFPDKPSLNYGNGDGTVNIRSLRGCLSWSNTHVKLTPTGILKPTKKRKTSVVEIQRRQKQPIIHKEFPGVEHIQILKDAGVISYLKTTIQSINNITTNYPASTVTT